MVEPVVVTAYKVSKCGYYSDDSTVNSLGSLDEILPDLQAWIRGLASVGESSTFEPSEDGQVLRTFCFDFRQIPNGNRILIATWNESENSDDAIQLLEVNAAIGEADVSHVKIENDALPGYPAYFVLDPTTNILLNLRFENRLNGSKSFATYILGFLTREGAYCQYDPMDAEKMLGYGPPGAAPSKDYIPLFQYQILRRGGGTDWLRAQVSNIRKVVRRATIFPKIEEHKPMLSGIRKFLGLGVNNRLSAGINVEYSFKKRFDADELERVLESCSPGAQEDDSWDDVGFVMAKDSSKIHWVSGRYAREKSTLTIDRTAGGRIDTERLAENLADHYDRLLAEAWR